MTYFWNRQELAFPKIPHVARLSLTVFELQLFEPVRSSVNNDYLSKLVAIEGDISKLKLGLSDDDYTLLSNNVNYVYHCAATVRFNHELKTAVLINVRGTREVVELCKNMKNLKVLTHVSTCFSNTNRSHIEEKVYPTLYNWKDVVKIAENNSLAELETLVSIFKGAYPNTYVFTKQLAEKVVDDAKYEVPSIICRPPIVTPIMEEPLVGWSDNLNGSYAIAIGILKGVLRILYGDPHTNLAKLPGDICTKCLIVYTWIRATGQKLDARYSDMDVVNMSTLRIYMTTLRNVTDSCIKHYPRFPTYSMRVPRLDISGNYVYFWYKTYTSHLLFAVIMDAALRIVGQKPIVLGYMRRLLTNNLLLVKEMTTQYRFDDENFFKAQVCLKDEDSEEFGSPFAVDLDLYMLNTFRGTSVYVLKEYYEEEKLDRIRFALEIMDWAVTVFEILFFGFLLWKLPKLLQII